ncbi:MAG TPA: glycosyltransferase family 87 protein [Geminicoccaceae bacterium]|nr:glycosyltransferase family 87 protein [Geminicoccaceae bacterium]
MRSRPSTGAWTAAGAVVLACALWLLRTAMHSRFISFDFQVFYVAGQLWNTGLDPYDGKLFAEHMRPLLSEPFPDAWLESSFLYPPQAAAVFGLLARLPMEQAHLVVLAVNLVAVAAAVLLLMLLLAEEIRLGPVEVAILACLALTAFGPRGLANSQWAPLAACFGFASILAERRGRPVLAGLLLAGMSLKPSFLPFFGAFFLLRRAWTAFVVAVAVTLVVTFLPLVLTGRPVLPAIMGLRANFALQAAPGGINAAGPAEPYWKRVTMIDLAPVGLQLTAGNALPLRLFVAVLGLVVALTVWRGRAKPGTALADLALLSACGLLAVYHRRYDGFLLFPAVAWLLLRARQSGAGWWWQAVVAAVVVVLVVVEPLFVILSQTRPWLVENVPLWTLGQPYPWLGLAAVVALLRERWSGAGATGIPHALPHDAPRPKHPTHAGVAQR